MKDSCLNQCFFRASAFFSRTSNDSDRPGILFKYSCQNLSHSRPNADNSYHIMTTGMTNFWQRIVLT